MKVGLTGELLRSYSPSLTKLKPAKDVPTWKDFLSKVGGAPPLFPSFWSRNMVFKEIG
jgi:hypothetical protein